MNFFGDLWSESGVSLFVVEVYCICRSVMNEVEVGFFFFVVEYLLRILEDVYDEENCIFDFFFFDCFWYFFCLCLG